MALLTATSLLSSPLGPTPVCAQGPVDQTDATQADAAQSGGDLPDRVGRLAQLDGTVSMHGPGATQWSPAILNFPFTSGDSLWTEPPAQADIEIGDDRLTLAAHTELDLATLDDRTVIATEPQGGLFLDLHGIGPGETWTLNTPRGAVQIAATGQYEILAGDASTPTRVVIASGAAQLTSGDLVLRGGAGQMLVATGTGALQGDIEPLGQPDAFLAAMLARDGTPAPVPQAAIGMTGADQLAAYGSWQQDPNYGEVWFPQVGPSWAPYTDGSWDYVDPWGWTWVDAEPWGFAPFHYGRWFQSHRRWGWTPGAHARSRLGPTYAPALVDFLAIGVGVGLAAGVLAASLHSGHGSIGWVPLGPHEAYRPAYHASPNYLDRLDRGGGWHQPHWNGSPAGDGYVNRAALVTAPATSFLRSSRLGGNLRPAPASGSIQPLQGGLPLRPGPAAGNFAIPAMQNPLSGVAPEHRAAPGPALTVQQSHVGNVAAGGGTLPIRPVAPGLAPRRPVAPGPASPAPSLLPHVTTPYSAPGPGLGGPRSGFAEPFGEREGAPRIQTPYVPRPVQRFASPHSVQPRLQQQFVRPHFQGQQFRGQEFQGQQFRGPQFRAPQFQGPRMAPVFRPPAPAVGRPAPAPALGRGAPPAR